MRRRSGSRVRVIVHEVGEIRQGKPLPSDLGDDRARQGAEVGRAVLIRKPGERSPVRAVERFRITNSAQQLVGEPRLFWVSGGGWRTTGDAIRARLPILTQVVAAKAALHALPAMAEKPAGLCAILEYRFAL